MAYRIFAYDNNSKSANLLKESLGALFLKKKGSTYVKKPGDVVINWGSSEDKPCKMLNGKVWVGVNKTKFFETISVSSAKDVIPAFWTSSKDIPASEYPIVCRTTVTGQDGAGITIAKTPAEIVPAKLYTKFIKAQKEYRIHVGKGPKEVIEVLCVQRKGKLNGSTNPVTDIKTTSNDYVFVHGETAPDVVLDAAKRVLKVIGTDFGGFDVLYDGADAYVLEVNSAPELGKTACEAYAEYFKSFAVAAEGDIEVPAPTSQVNKLPEAILGAKPVSGFGAENSSNGLVGSGKESAGVLCVEVPTSGPAGNLYGDVLGKDSVSILGKTAKLSGGDSLGLTSTTADTAGLMFDLEKAIQSKIDAAFKAGVASIKPGYTKADIDEAFATGHAHGTQAVKAQLKSLLAA